MQNRAKFCAPHSINTDAKSKNYHFSLYSYVQRSSTIVLLKIQNTIYTHRTKAIQFREQKFSQQQK